MGTEMCIGGRAAAEWDGPKVDHPELCDVLGPLAVPKAGPACVWGGVGVGGAAAAAAAIVPINSVRSAAILASGSYPHLTLPTISSV